MREKQGGGRSVGSRRVAVDASVVARLLPARSGCSLSTLKLGTESRNRRILAYKPRSWYSQKVPVKWLVLACAMVYLSQIDWVI